MNTFEKALNRCSGLETTAEELDALLTKEDIGINDLSDLELICADYDEMEMNYEYAERLSVFGHGAKYFF